MCLPISPLRMQRERCAFFVPVTRWMFFPGDKETVVIVIYILSTAGLIFVLKVGKQCANKVQHRATYHYTARHASPVEGNDKGNDTEYD